MFSVFAWREAGKTAGVSKALSLCAGSARFRGTSVTVLCVRVCSETTAYAFGNGNLRFELGPAPETFARENHKFCFVCADACHLVVKGARISDPFLVVSSRKMATEVGMYAGIFLLLCLHLTPVVHTRFGQVARFSTCVFSLSLCFVKVSISY